MTIATQWQWARQWLRTALRARRQPRRTVLSLEALEARDLLAPGDFRIVSYNIASSGGAPRMGLDTILQAIGNEPVNGRTQQIDILALQEVQSQATTTQAVVNLLNGIYPSSTYARGNLDGATTGFGRPGVVYNTATLQLLSETVIGTSSTMGQPRQAVRYHFHPIGFPSSADFYVYNSHYNAGQSPPEQARRLPEAMAIRADADALGPGPQVIYLGDHNVYTVTEDGYEHLLSPGNGQAFDPISRPGAWHVNANFIDVFTQAPAVSPDAPLVGGGLDDRFDQQLITAELFDGAGLDYRYRTLHPFGNNGSVPLNGNVNDPMSTALPTLPNHIEVLNRLADVSDHLPVVADYTVNVPSALTVTWLEPTRTGFTARFDRAIDPSMLNLYDVQAGTLGPADVTLVGRSTGPVTGSLVVSPDSRAVTFIRTGTSFLSSDTYTVTLRSAANGFKDTAGVLLDGNGDGVPGDAFTTLFSIPATPARDDDGIHVVAYFGDVTGNRGYSAGDATQALRVAVGLDMGFLAFQLADPVIVADINASGGITSGDATNILRKGVGLAVAQIPDPPEPLPPFVQGGPDPLLSFPKRLRGQRGRTVTVPLNLDPSDGLQSADLAIAYDTSRLELVGVRRGNLTKGFDLFAANVDPEAGTIRVGLGRSTGPLTGRGKGSVLRVTFRIRANAPEGEAVINLRRSLGTTATQLNEGGLDLNPDPSNEAGDALDGVITVHGSVRVRHKAKSSAAVAGQAALADLVFAGLARRRKG